jgi:DNA-binding NarL/FixJ family response regulator
MEASQMAKGEKVSAEQVVRDIRRETRRKYSAEEKIRIVLEGLRGEDSIAGLTEREIEVLRLTANGLSKRQMAQRLNLSEKTIDSHVTHIYEKIHVSTRAAAALFAVQHNLLSNVNELP